MDRKNKAEGKTENKTEKKAEEKTEKSKEWETVQLTRQLVQIDSSDPGAFEGNIKEFVKSWLVAHAPGAKILTREVLPGRENLCAILEGEETNPALIFICHMDTVVLGEGWKQSTPLSGEIIDDRIYGRGSCDMKSGLACGMTAFARAVQKAAGGKPRYTLKLIVTVDEEDFMRGAEQVIQSGWVDTRDWILDMEPTDGQIRVAHKGRSWFELEVEGITAHASTPWKGADAIAGISYMICEIQRAVKNTPVHPDLGNTTVTFGMIEGGYRPYVVPNHAKVWIDMRLAPPMTDQLARRILEQAIQEGEQKVPGVKGSFQSTGARPFVEKDETSLLLADLKNAVKAVTGAAAKTGIFPGYTDTAVIAGTIFNHNCMSYGPGNLENAHKPDEYVTLDDIVRCKKVLDQLIDYRLYKDLTLGRL